MKSIAKIALVVSTLIVPQISNAAPPSGTITGSIQIAAGSLVANCNIQFTITGTSTSVAITPGDPACYSLIYGASPMTMSGSTLTMWLHLNTGATSCWGEIGGPWDGTTWTFVGVLPGNGGYGPHCSVHGTAS